MTTDTLIKVQDPERISLGRHERRPEMIGRVVLSVHHHRAHDPLGVGVGGDDQAEIAHASNLARSRPPSG